MSICVNVIIMQEVEDHNMLKSQKNSIFRKANSLHNMNARGKERGFGHDVASGLASGDGKITCLKDNESLLNEQH